MAEWKKNFGQLLVAGLLSGGVIAAVFSFLAHGYKTEIEAEIKNQFNVGFEIFRSQRNWKEQSLSELLGPINMNLRRTKLAFMRWDSQNLYIEMKIMQESNKTARDLLLTKGHLIPPELRQCASKLIEHYDLWLEKFEEKRLSEKPDLETKFIFVGPDGYPFPKGCEQDFNNEYQKMWKDVYGDN